MVVLPLEQGSKAPFLGSIPPLHVSTSPFECRSGSREASRYPNTVLEGVVGD